MQLAFEGPYAATGRGIGPALSGSRSASGTGIYFWCVPLQSTIRVAYLGKTVGSTRSFSTRIREEVDRFRLGQDGCFDLADFKRGVRTRIPLPAAGRDELLEALIECSPVFVAPIPPGPTDVLALESHLIRSIQGHSNEARAFLAHGGRLLRRPFAESLELVFPNGVVVEGLTSVRGTAKADAESRSRAGERPC